MATAPWTDPIVDEVHRIRREMLAKFDNDLDKYWEHLMKAQELHADRLVYRPALPEGELAKRLARAFPEIDLDTK